MRIFKIPEYTETEMKTSENKKSSNIPEISHKLCKPELFVGFLQFQVKEKSFLCYENYLIK